MFYNSTSPPFYSTILAVLISCVLVRYIVALFFHLSCPPCSSSMLSSSTALLSSSVSYLQASSLYLHTTTLIVARACTHRYFISQSIIALHIGDFLSSLSFAIARLGVVNVIRVTMVRSVGAKSGIAGVSLLSASTERTDVHIPRRRRRR